MNYNKVFLGGIVKDEPEFSVNPFLGETLTVVLQINRKDIGKIEEVSCIIMNDSMITRGLQEIHQGEYMMVTNAKLMTNNYTRNVPLICPHCQEVYYKPTQSEMTNVVVHNFEMMPAMDIQNSIGINKVLLIGNVCSELIDNPTKGTNVKQCVKYKIMVSRPGRTGHKKTADFPFIVAFSELAEIAKKNYKNADLLFIEGSLQERKIRQKRELLCGNCGQKSSPIIHNTVKEIIANRTTKIISATSDEQNTFTEILENLEQ